MDQVGKGGVAEESLTRVDGVLETTNLTTYILLHGVDLRLEMTEHLFVDGFVGHADNLTLDILLHQMTVLVGELDLGICHVLNITAGVDAKHFLAFFVGDPVVVHLMVVSEEDDVESRHFLGHSLGGVLLVLVGLDTAFQS